MTGAQAPRHRQHRHFTCGHRDQDDRMWAHCELQTLTLKHTQLKVHQQLHDSHLPPLEWWSTCHPTLRSITADQHSFNVRAQLPILKSTLTDVQSSTSTPLFSSRREHILNTRRIVGIQGQVIGPSSATQSNCDLLALPIHGDHHHSNGFLHLLQRRFFLLIMRSIYVNAR